MRWIWIDRILELERATRCVAIKNVSAAEEVLHDHFEAEGTPGEPGYRAAMPILPAPLIIEGMAQTAGILVGHARDFREKVILAKIGKAKFHGLARPGFTVRYTADVDRIDASGAATIGKVELLDPATGEASSLADIELMFSHIDQNRAGLEFPEHNFVFTSQFMDLLERSGFGPDQPTD